MTMILDEKTVGIWYLQLDDLTDIMLQLSTTENTDEYVLTGRLRFYNPSSENPFDQRDEKRWFKFKRNFESKHVAIQSVKTTILSNILVKANIKECDIDETLMGDSVDEFIERFLAKPYVSFKTTPINTLTNPSQSLH